VEFRSGLTTGERSDVSSENRDGCLDLRRREGYGWWPFRP